MNKYDTLLFPTLSNSIKESFRKIDQARNNNIYIIDSKPLKI